MYGQHRDKPLTHTIGHSLCSGSSGEAFFLSEHQYLLAHLELPRVHHREANQLYTPHRTVTSLLSQTALRSATSFTIRKTVVARRYCPMCHVALA